MKLPVSSAIQTFTTANPGSGWTALATVACHEVAVVNNTGTDLEFRRGGAGTALVVPDGAGWVFESLANANELQIRRVDQSNTQVTQTYEVTTR
ncbi:MAG: hypothetical protein Q7R45_01450 [Sulfuricaulis sp.]|nr:hypothetical protein [Sulfuricaulis sp.]